MIWIIDNWEIVTAFICVLMCIVENIYIFYKEPKSKRIENVREWVLWAVVEAEKKYKGGTGALKLHAVYNMACERFKWLPSVVTFDTFSQWVDEALIWMRVQLTSNENVKSYIEDKDNDN